MVQHLLQLSSSSHCNVQSNASRQKNLYFQKLWCGVGKPEPVLLPALAVHVTMTFSARVCQKVPTDVYQLVD